MYQQDYILNEIRKMTLIFARLIGLKEEGKMDEYEQLFDETLQNEYNIELEALLTLNEADFKTTLLAGNYSAEKLHALSQMLYVFAEPFDRSDETQLILKKVLRIFDIIEQVHHTESFENLEKRKFIYGYFNNL